MGHASYSGGAVDYRNFCDNVSDLKSDYVFACGYFGKKGNGKNKSVRHIESDNPLLAAHDFYNRAANGGLREVLGFGKWKTTMGDGTVLTMREVSSSDGSPAVDINITRGLSNGDIKNQKIHFVERVVG